MKALLSIQVWIDFLGKFFDVVFPTVILLLAFSWNGIKGLKKTPALRFFMVFLVLVFASRIFLFLSGVPYQGRYLYPLSILMSMIAALGLDGMIGFLQSRKILKSLPPAKIAFAAVAVLIMINAGKALWYVPSKQWVKDVSSFVRQSHDGRGNAPVLISGVHDMRLAYYSKAKLLDLIFSKFSKYTPQDRKFKCQILKMDRGTFSTLEWMPLYNIEGAGDFTKAVMGIDSPKVFLLLDDKDRSLLKMYEDAGASLPFKPVAAFKEGKKKTFTLYERIPR